MNFSPLLPIGRTVVLLLGFMTKVRAAVPACVTQGLFSTSETSGRWMGR